MCYVEKWLTQISRALYAGDAIHVNWCPSVGHQDGGHIKSNRNKIMHLSMLSPRGGEGNPGEFDRDAYPQGGDFDLTSCI